MVGVEVAGAILGAVTLARLPFIWPLFWRGAIQPLAICGAIWTLWLLCTVLWTPDIRQGVQEVGASRWLYACLMFPAILNRRDLLIRMLKIGLALGVVVQILEAAAHGTGAPWMSWAIRAHPAEPGGDVTRFSGWWFQPALGGTMLVGALGLHLPGAVFGRGAARWYALAGCLLTATGLMLTGTRGAWLTAGALTSIVLIIKIACFASDAGWTRRRVVSAFALVAAGAIALLAGAWFGSSTIRDRTTTGIREVSTALTQGNYHSDMGYRLLMAKWAVQAWRENPIAGIGAGGYRNWVTEHLEDSGENPEAFRRLPQAHNTLLHSLSTTGIIGAVLMLLTVAAGILGLAPTAPAAGTRASRLAGVFAQPAAAPLCAFVGLLFASAFETLYVNATTAAFATVLMALGIPMWRTLEAARVPISHPR